MLQSLLITIQTIDKAYHEIPIKEICEKIDCQPERLKQELDQLSHLGFIKLHSGWVSLTEMGRLNNLP